MNINEDLAQRYEENSSFHVELKRRGITILQGYRNNKTNIEKFYDYFYKDKYPKIVLCGINPGRYGAGKTGIPFIDFETLKNIFRTIFGESDIIPESERSAQFIKNVIERFEGGYINFFQKVYLTNYSFIGFIKENRNYNYFELQEELKSFIDEMFVYEMNIVNPEIIIPLSVTVEESLNKVESLKSCLKPRLPHPYYCSFRKTNENLNIYLERLKGYIKI